MLHAVFLPIVQCALDDMRAMWNEHPIRSRPSVEGHFGGIPNLLFAEPVGSATLLTRDDEAFYATRGVLDPETGADDGGRFGVETRAMREEAPCGNEQKATLDPLGCCATLQSVRKAYLQATPLLASGGNGFDPYVREYIRYKTVCTELLECWNHHWDPQAQALDWDGFGASRSADASSRRSGAAPARPARRLLAPAPS